MSKVLRTEEVKDTQLLIISDEEIRKKAGVTDVNTEAWGTYNTCENKIWLNEEFLNDVEIIETLIHETRHVFQRHQIWWYPVFRPDYSDSYFLHHSYFGNIWEIKENEYLWNRIQDMYNSFSSVDLGINNEKYDDLLHEQDAQKFAEMLKIIWISE